MNDVDRHDQIEALKILKELLDDENADASDIRDAAIRAVNRFDASIAALPQAPRFSVERLEADDRPPAGSPRSRMRYEAPRHAFSPAELRATPTPPSRW